MPLRQDVYTDKGFEVSVGPPPAPTVAFSRLLRDWSAADGIVAADLFPRCTGNATLDKVVNNAYLIDAEEEVPLNLSAKISHRVSVSFVVKQPLNDPVDTEP